MAAMLLALAVPLGVMVWKHEFRRQPLTTGIAVLPFENLGEQKENAAFVDGLQDDILTKLAKIGDLKVISRTSVMDYRGKRNLRQIGNDLRVSHVLEGSVRRSGMNLRLNAQLIDTRTDTHVWAEQYDRDLNDLFAVQSEIAQTVAERLNAKVTSAEKLAIEGKPTTDLMAFEFYSRANDIILERIGDFASFTDLAQAIDLLNQAVARDPSFLQAYCQLAVAHDALYWWELDRTPARLAMAEAAVQEALRTRPNAGEAHYARAVHLYRGYRDFDGALAELKVARQTLPNHAPIFEMMGFIQRRQGRLEESTRNLERAADLDPRNVTTGELASNYILLGRDAEAKSLDARAAVIAGPDDLATKLQLASLDDTLPCHQVIDSIRATNPAAIPQVAGWWLDCALYERDAAAATEALNAAADNARYLLHGDHIYFTRSFVEGLIARMTNDEHQAQLAFAAARAEQEKIVQAQPDYPFPLCVLGVIDAGLGRKEEALCEGRRAVELLPVEKDAVDGKMLVTLFAIISAWLGEKDLACEQLALATRPPGSVVSYGALKLLPWWDPLRSEPCFEKIVASLAPKETVSK
jgi:TolB-like protein/Tfp pilus assembly protein PilF